MTPEEPLERHIVGHAVAGGLDPFPKRRQVAHEERRVRLARGHELGLLDAEVHLEIAVTEPDPAARRELRRLLDLGQAQDGAVEPDGCLFLAFGHRQLYVMQPQQLRGVVSHPRTPSQERNGPGANPRPEVGRSNAAVYEQPLVLPQVPQT